MSIWKRLPINRPELLGGTYKGGQVTVKVPFSRTKSTDNPIPADGKADDLALRKRRSRLLMRILISYDSQGRHLQASTFLLGMCLDTLH